ncbi:MAG: hypothetical protein JW861_00880 [Bacteroidales bacterium]|nr:hypothetical protein [Bacteroidales bacterium]
MNKIPRFFICLTLSLLPALLSPLRAQSNGEDPYHETIASADKYFSEQDYINAKASYEYASKLRPDEEYPRERLRETIGLLRSRMVTVEQYQSVISEADKAFISGSLDAAVRLYADAGSILPGESYPAERIAEITRIREKEQDEQEGYRSAVESGDRFFEAREYKAALEEYRKASLIYPGEAYPLDRIVQIEDIILRLRDARQSYDESIASADRLFNLKYYAEAKKEYEKAREVMPGESYPESRISEIGRILQKKDLYDALVAEGDDLYVARAFEQAKAKYQEALSIFPDESYPEGMIDKINQSFREERDREQLYSAAIADADRFFSQEDYSNARKEYENALSIKPGESYPAGKIEEIDERIAASLRMNQEYQQAVTNGEGYFREGSLPQALAEFKKASELKPSETYPRDRMEEISGMLAVGKQRQDVYQTAISEGDRLFSSQDYAGAAQRYNEALAVFPQENYPAGKIAEIEMLLKAGRENQQKYEALIGEADNMFKKGSWEQAREKYLQASGIIPGETYPAEQISRIDQLIIEQRNLEENQKPYEKAMAEAEKLIQKELWPDARIRLEQALTFIPGDAAAAAKLDEVERVISEQQLQQESYDQIIAYADKLFAEKKYEEARIQYQKALTIKPGESHPSERIREINRIIENQRLSLNLYNQAIAEADRFLEQKNYKSAIQAYQNAGNLMPTEQYPRQKIFEINKMMDEQKALDDQYRAAVADGDKLYGQSYYEQARLRYQDALDLKPGEGYPAGRIAEIDGILTARAEQDNAFNGAISEADQLFNVQKYEEARMAYLKAGNLKPGEPYPQERIREIDLLIRQHEERMQSFNKLIASGDNAFQMKSWEDARSSYEKALELIPGEDYPRQKLLEIDAILLSEKDATEQAYNSAITQGDIHMANAEYEPARKQYQEALNIKPGESYPKEKMAEIDGLVADLKTRQANYSRIIGDGDTRFRARDFQEAKAKYSEAAALMPGEEYPRSRIEEINRIFQEEQKQVRGAYDRAIADADKFFMSGIYDQAIDSYREAQNIIPTETYPAEMIGKIYRIMEENAVRDLLDTPLSLQDLEEKRFPFEPVSIADRKSNYVYLRIRNAGQVEFKVLLNYGRDGSKNGGVIIKVPPGEGENEYIVRVGQQYKWFTEDNNWVGLIPEGGSVEITKVKISRSGQ